jgi:hypothetical protein
MGSSAPSNIAPIKRTHDDYTPSQYTFVDSRTEAQKSSDEQNNEKCRFINKFIVPLATVMTSTVPPMGYMDDLDEETETVEAPLPDFRIIPKSKCGASSMVAENDNALIARLLAELMSLVNHDVDVANRLLEAQKVKFPHDSSVSIYKDVVYFLKRDRGVL